MDTHHVFSCNDLVSALFKPYVIMFYIFVILCYDIFKSILFFVDHKFLIAIIFLIHILILLTKKIVYNINILGILMNTLKNIITKIEL